MSGMKLLNTEMQCIGRRSHAKWSKRKQKHCAFSITTAARKLHLNAVAADASAAAGVETRN